MKKPVRVLIYALFIVYCFALIYLLFFYSDFRTYYGGWFFDYAGRNSNLIPFKTIIEYFRRLSDGSINTSSFVINMVGNVAAFVPLGLLLPFVFNNVKRNAAYFLIGAAIVICIELIQIFSMRGHLDVDDFILNMIGYALGFAINRAIIHFSSGGKETNI